MKNKIAVTLISTILSVGGAFFALSLVTEWLLSPMPFAAFERVPLLLNNVLFCGFGCILGMAPWLNLPGAEVPGPVRFFVCLYGLVAFVGGAYFVALVSEVALLNYPTFVVADGWFVLGYTAFLCGFGLLSMYGAIAKPSATS